MKTASRILIVIGFCALTFRLAAADKLPEAHLRQPNVSPVLRVDTPRSLLNPIRLASPIVTPRVTVVPRLTLNKARTTYPQQPARLPAPAKPTPILGGRAAATTPLGGLTAASVKRSTGILDGTTMKRKSW